jgi:DNA-binding protein HU-beta
MTKAELIDRIARSRDLPPEVTKKIIAKILDLAFSELSGYFVRARVTRTSNPRFTFPKFGTFTKKQRSGRRGVNPRTLEPIEIEACDTVDFKPSVELKRQMNEAANAKPSAASRKSARAVEPVVEVGRKKKAARTSSKRRPTPSAGPGGRKLVTREEAELELPSSDPLLPDAPLRKVARRRRDDLEDLTGT